MVNNDACVLDHSSTNRFPRWWPFAAPDRACGIGRHLTDPIGSPALRTLLRIVPGQKPGQQRGQQRDRREDQGLPNVQCEEVAHGSSAKSSAMAQSNQRPTAGMPFPMTFIRINTKRTATNSTVMETTAPSVRSSALSSRPPQTISVGISPTARSAERGWPQRTAPAMCVPYRQWGCGAGNACVADHFTRETSALPNRSITPVTSALPMKNARLVSVAPSV